MSPAFRCPRVPVLKVVQNPCPLLALSSCPHPTTSFPVWSCRPKFLLHPPTAQPVSNLQLRAGPTPPGRLRTVPEFVRCPPLLQYYPFNVQFA